MRLYFYIFCITLLLFAKLGNAKIVFDSKRDGSYGIYVMDDDGSNEMLLTDMFSPTDPFWSPNGKLIVFRDVQHQVVILKKRIYL